MLTTTLALLTLTSLAAQADKANIASSDQAMECYETWVRTIAPAHSFEGAPVDAVPLVEFEGDCGPHTWELVLKEVASGEVLVKEEVDALYGEYERIHVVDPGVDLEAGRTYALFVRPLEEWGQAAESLFTVGEHTARGIDAAPQVDLYDAGTYDGGVYGEFSADIFPATDPDGLSMVHLELADGSGEELARHVVGDQEQVYVYGTTNLRELDELCVVAVQTDALGQEWESEPSCVAVLDYSSGGILPWDCGGMGCSTAPGSPRPLLPALPLALVALVGLRRRS